MKNCLFLGVVILVSVFLHSASCYAVLTNELIDHHSVNLELKNKGLTDVLSALSEQIGVEIVFFGEHLGDMQDFKFQGIPILSAIDQIARRYKVENYAIVYNTNKDNEKIKLYGYSDKKSKENSSFSRAQVIQKVGVVENPITDEQLDLLAAKSQLADLDQNSQPLKLEQLNQLNEKSGITEDDEENVPLLDEQKQALRERGGNDFHDIREPLAKEKLMKLHGNEEQ